MVSRRSARNQKESVPHRERDQEANNQQREERLSRQVERVATEVPYLDPRIRLRQC